MKTPIVKRQCPFISHFALNVSKRGSHGVTIDKGFLTSFRRNFNENYENTLNRGDALVAVSIDTLTCPFFASLHLKFTRDTCSIWVFFFVSESKHREWCTLLKCRRFSSFDALSANASPLKVWKLNLRPVQLLIKPDQRRKCYGNGRRSHWEHSGWCCWRDETCNYGWGGPKISVKRYGGASGNSTILSVLFFVHSTLRMRNRKKMLTLVFTPNTGLGQISKRYELQRSHTNPKIEHSHDAELVQRDIQLDMDGLFIDSDSDCEE